MAAPERLRGQRAATRLVAREATPSYGAQSTAFVVDASVSAAWFLPDEATAYTRAALHASATSAVWVPMLWLPEMANLLRSAQRRRRITAAKRAELRRIRRTGSPARDKRVAHRLPRLPAPSTCQVTALLGLGQAHGVDAATAAGVGQQGVGPLK